MFKDMRRAPRTRTVLTGILYAKADGFTSDCVINDVSETGARIKTQAGSIVPGDVFLIQLRDYVAHHAKVAWRRDNGSLGLTFMSKQDLRDGSANAPVAAMRALCVEHSLRTVMPEN